MNVSNIPMLTTYLRSKLLLLFSDGVDCCYTPQLNESEPQTL